MNIKQIENKDRQLSRKKKKMFSKMLKFYKEIDAKSQKKKK